MLVARVGQSFVRAAPRKLAQARSIHIPISGRLLSPTKSTNLAHRARTFIARFIAHLQTPPVSRSIHSSPSIRQSLSLPARVALSRPLRAPCLPRAPRIPGNITQVGLGTARNFSTGRPIFQHIVDNVPVAGRAFYELDWDVKMREEKNAKIHRSKKSTHKVKSGDKLQPRHERPARVERPVEEYEEFDLYFSAPSVLLTTTYLQIPLAPTPTARVPLSSEPSPYLLPLPALAKEHASHSKHSIKVSSLFRRLDAARVWEKGASCQTFGDPSGLCTVLRVKFEGWTEEMVKSVLGDAGRGWCIIQEIHESSLPKPATESPVSTPLMFSCELATPETSDVEGISFVMPELDFSASSLSPRTGSRTPLSSVSLNQTDTDYSIPSAPQSVWDDDSPSEVSSLGSYEMTDGWSSAAGSPRTQSWLGFSSDFANAVSSNLDNPFI